MKNSNAIEAIQLTKSYGDNVALSGIDLAIERGGVTSLLGANGAGKTTFIRCALGLTNATSGSIRVLNESAGSFESRIRIGAMLQDADLPDLLTAREHLALFASYYSNPLTVDEAVALCQIEPFERTVYKKLSGGQKRRVQFALAIVGQPDLLFLDEPTTGLDGEARQVVWNLVRNIASEGKTVILTTHNMQEAEHLSDMIAIVAQGRLLTHTEVQALQTRKQEDVIRCMTSLDIAQLSDFKHVDRAYQSGRFVEVVTTNATTTIREMLASDEHLSNLTISKTSLEQAISRLTDEPTFLETDAADD